eukprot:TRINITY_DN12458_c1_g1_i10.p2 TRINITY_DN12458_c1_g1~~TRINITY_DN12458_c1_g1_i10.p2  ORF type:complete len:233 (+),score=36.49 TRINITY_DN12458_c1_g1_i10:1441-2139(+)
MADDPELDFCAETFDPVKALNSDNVVVPYPNVKALDNLARYETMLKASKAKPEAKPKSTEFKVNEASHPSHPDRIKERRAKMAAKRADKDPDDAVQAPKSKRRKARKTHLLDYLDGTATKLSKSEPLAMLHSLLHERVSVRIRNGKTVLGHCQGLLQGYDSHYSVVLVDATKTVKCTALATRKSLHPDRVETTRRQKRRGKGLVTHTIEKVSRHAQLFVRGEQIIHIARLPA